MFHGTIISVYQRNENNLRHKKFSYENKTHLKLKILELSENYTNITPAKWAKPELPGDKLQWESFLPSDTETRNEATAWLDGL